MGLDDLNSRYGELRGALEAAYLAPVWDSEHIDRLTEDIRAIELALGSMQGRRSESRDNYTG